MLRVVVRVESQMYESLAEAGKLDLLADEWRDTLVNTFAFLRSEAILNDFQVVWQPFPHATNMGYVLSLDVTFTPGEGDMYTPEAAEVVALEITSDLSDALLRSRHLPIGQYAVWTMPQLNAGYVVRDRYF